MPGVRCCFNVEVENMKGSSIFILCLLAVVAMGNSVKAQGWRELVPLKSTCEDVKRVMKVTSCKPYYEYYEVDGERFQIGFTEHPCAKAFGRVWNVPVGTVTYIAHMPKEPIPLAEVISDVSKCEKGLTHTGIAYTCNEEGLWLDVYHDGRVAEITYVPKLSDNHLQCSPTKRVPKVHKQRRGVRRRAASNNGMHPTRWS
jgi:hypothetical protein